MAAGSTAVFIILGFFAIRLIGLRMAAVDTHFEKDNLGDWFPAISRELFFLVGFSIMAVWSNLAITGRWVAEKSWIDRFGRILAIYWIAISIVSIFEL